MTTPQRFFIVDGSALAYRSHFAFMRNPLLRSSDGMNTSAVLGFINSLLKLLDEESPERLAVVFDSREPTFRHVMFADYKATRDKMPEDLSCQLPYINRFVEAMGFPCLSIPGVEADDVIGTLAVQARDMGMEVFMVTGDKDFMQLLGPSIRMYIPRKGGDWELVDASGVPEKWDVEASQIIDLLGLMGDSSDNIPGVKGVGGKTAASLLQQFGSMDEIYRNLDQIKGKARENLERDHEIALLSRDLATIRTNVELDVSPDTIIPAEIHREKLATILRELEFRALAKKLGVEDEFIRQTAEIPEFMKGVSSSATSATSNDSTGSAASADTFNGETSESHSAAEAALPVHPWAHELEAGRPSLASVTREYRTLCSDDIPELLGHLMAAPEVAFDLETTSLDPYNAEIVGFSFSTEPGKAAFLPCLGGKGGGQSQSGGGQLSLFATDKPVTDTRILNALKPFFDATSTARTLADGSGISDRNDKNERNGRPDLSALTMGPVKGGQNLKYDLSILQAHGIAVNGVGFDTMIESYLIDPTLRGHNIDFLALRYLGFQKIATKEVMTKGMTMDQADPELLARYACEDADICMRLHQLFTPVIHSMKLDSLYRNVELPLMHILRSMEMKGIRIDRSVLAELEREMSAALEDIQLKIWKEAGEEFNINSPKQMGPILFEKLKIHETLGKRKIKKTRTGMISTDSQVLEDYSGIPVVSQILEYRSLAKLLGTYVQALPGMINPVTGRVHTSFNQTVTATGRLSSSDPNLQNIPIRTPLGRMIRKAFVGEKGKVLMAADYSQIELRVLAHLCDDPDLQEAFGRDIDIHTHTASRIFNLPMEQVDKDMRSKAKTINFGILYGMGPTRLARENNISIKEAKDFIADYFDKYPHIKQYSDSCVETALNTGIARTILGRVRPVPEVHSRNQGVKVNGEHIALNTPIQGSAADIIKLAMIEIQKTLREKMPEASMILQVHDELVFEVDQSRADELENLVRESMEKALKLSVPLKVDIGRGPSWFEAH
ncbi:MAG: DNA polymerase I [Candidatus Wallbacteria bacterium HGW-Wallbacteria-1]|jgi:DNA polymerase-1|uniref:DNA polymerase I n=1 Tax=Candidatus Wallbacteria bacterium HGW-Wallbacteria-1 TaxID=2013854 RepID=A0A2N1PN76_9BACT|nr:MAG: DNA polymerase I [Candidatus Wallbacteria bacterium HGW-Wallbacteria-1]